MSRASLGGTRDRRLSLDSGARPAGAGPRSGGRESEGGSSEQVLGRLRRLSVGEGAGGAPSASSLASASASAPAPARGLEGGGSSLGTRRPGQQPSSTGVGAALGFAQATATGVGSASNEARGVLEDGRHMRVRWAKCTLAGLESGGHKKTNQDAYLILPGFRGVRTSHVFGVMDGHGADGHMASGYIKREFKAAFRPPAPGASARAVAGELKRAMLALHRGLADHRIDFSLSGSTAVMVYMEGTELYVANVGGQPRGSGEPAAAGAGAGARGPRHPARAAGARA